MGSAWHAEDVIRAWPEARVAQVGDSLAYLFHRPIRLTDWGTNKHFPSFFQVGDARWTMEQFVTRLTRAYPDVTFARFNHANDNVQEAFYEAVGGNRVDFGPRLRAVEARLKQLPNYRSYLACGSEHCAFPTHEFGVAARRGRRCSATGCATSPTAATSTARPAAAERRGGRCRPPRDASARVSCYSSPLSEMPCSTARSASTMPWP